MQEDYLVFAIISVIIIVLISLFCCIANLQKTIIIREKKEKKKKLKNKKSFYRNHVELVAKRGTSKNDLTSAILEVAKNCPFPEKTKGIAPNMPKCI